ncbi:hypothetical protein ACRAWF_44065 [Streptomyces sp. L7]
MREAPRSDQTSEDVVLNSGDRPRPVRQVLPRLHEAVGLDLSGHANIRRGRAHPDTQPTTATATSATPSSSCRPDGYGDVPALLDIEHHGAHRRRPQEVRGDFPAYVCSSTPARSSAYFDCCRRPALPQACASTTSTCLKPRRSAGSRHGQLPERPRVHPDAEEFKHLTGETHAGTSIVHGEHPRSRRRSPRTTRCRGPRALFKEYAEMGERAEKRERGRPTVGRLAQYYATTTWTRSSRPLKTAQELLETPPT